MVEATEIKEILDDKEAAKLLGLSAHQVKVLARKGELPGRKVGNGRTSPWRFSRQQLLDYVEGAAVVLASLGLNATLL